MIPLVTWVVPPVLGAVIGYVTNAIAIRMLFRPYREWRVFGIHVPLTPGIIPKQRHELAESMGRMVSSELMTEDAILSQTQRSAFQDNIHSTISSLTEELFSRSPHFLLEEYGLSVDQAGGGTFLEKIIKGFFRSQGFRQVAEVTTAAALRFLSEFRLGELVGGEEGRTAMIARFLDLLTSEKAETTLRTAVVSWVDRQLEENSELGSFLGEGVVSGVTELMERIYDPAFAVLLQWLRTDEVRAVLESRGKKLLRGILSRLTVFQKFLIAATQYDRTIEENMSQIVDDTLEQAFNASKDPGVKERLIETVKKELVKARSTGFVELQEKIGGSIPERVDSVIAGLLSYLRSEAVRTSLSHMLDRALQSNADTTIGDLLERLLSIDDAASFVADLLSSRIHASADRLAEEAVAFMSQLSRENRGISLRELVGIDAAAKESLDRTLSQIAVGMINKKVPELLQSFDIQNLVASKIDALNVEEVEGLLMRVIHRHLRWINVFGAILGFLIGMTQALLRLMS